MDPDAKKLKLKQLLWQVSLTCLSLKKDFKRLCRACIFSYSSYFQVRQRQLFIILHATKQKLLLYALDSSLLHTEVFSLKHIF